MENITETLSLFKCLKKMHLLFKKHTHIQGFAKLGCLDLTDCPIKEHPTGQLKIKIILLFGNARFTNVFHEGIRNTGISHKQDPP